MDGVASDRGEDGGELLRLVAWRLRRDHDRTGGDGEAARCVACGQQWPCSGRRLAELGLNRAGTMSDHPPVAAPQVGGQVRRVAERVRTIR